MGVDPEGKLAIAMAYGVYKYGSMAISAYEIYEAAKRIMAYQEVRDSALSAMRCLEKKGDIATDQYRRIKENFDWANRQISHETSYIAIRSVTIISLSALRHIYHIAQLDNAFLQVVDVLSDFGINLLSQAY